MTIASNVALGNERGFLISGDRVRLDGNAAIGNAQTGFEVFGTGKVVTNNIATGNSIGFYLGHPGTTFSGNVAMANTQVGIVSEVEFSAELSGNTVIGNGVAGFRFRAPPQVAARMVIHRNNIFGNGDAAAGCGTINEGGGVVDATNNYWGKPNGPGPNPGDRAHGDCGAWKHPNEPVLNGPVPDGKCKRRISAVACEVLLHAEGDGIATSRS